MTARETDRQTETEREVWEREKNGVEERERGAREKRQRRMRRQGAALAGYAASGARRSSRSSGPCRSFASYDDRP